MVPDGHCELGGGVCQGRKVWNLHQSVTLLPLDQPENRPPDELNSFSCQQQLAQIFYFENELALNNKAVCSNCALILQNIHVDTHLRGLTNHEPNQQILMLS